MIMRGRGGTQELVAVCTASTPLHSGRSPVDGEQAPLRIIKVISDRQDNRKCAYTLGAVWVGTLYQQEKL